MARRGRCFWVRSAWAALVAALVLWGYHAWLARFVHLSERPEAVSELLESFFALFIGVQLALTFAIVPVYVASALAEEKERRTLDFLLATDLRGHEIVLGKLAARLANLALLFLVGLPVLSLLQLLGGIEPEFVAGGYALVGLSACSLAGLGILCSVYARRARDAVVWTFLLCVLYLVLSGASDFFLLHFLPREAGYEDLPDRSLSVGFGTLTVRQLVRTLNGGNLAVLFGDFFEDIRSGMSTPDALGRLLRTYASVSALWFVATVSWSSLRLRKVALGEMAVTTADRSQRSPKRWRPRVGRWPMLWKQAFATSRRQRLRLMVLSVLILVALALPPALFLTGSGGRWSYGPALVLGVARAGLAAGSCLLLLAVLVEAAGTLSGERERQTLDCLLTTPLSAPAILWGTWLGSILSVRWGWFWLALLWLEGYMAGGREWSTLPLLFGAWLVYAGAFASVGLYCSLLIRRSLWAVVAALVSAFTLCCGHWLLWIYYAPLIFFADDQPWWIERLTHLHFSLMPPVSLTGLAVPGLFGTVSTDRFCKYAVLGLLAWGFVQTLLWHGLVVRFRALANRALVRAPEFMVAGADNDTVRSRRRLGRRRSLRRRTFAIAAGIAVALLVPSAEYYAVGILAARDLQAAIAETDSADPSWRKDAIRVDDLPDDAQLSARLLEARALMPRGWMSPVSPPPGRPEAANVLWDRRQTQRLQQERVEAAAAIAKARTVNDISGARLPRSATQPGAAHPPFNYMDALEVAKLLQLEVYLLAQEGDSGAAMQAARAMMNCGRACGSPGGLMAALVRIADATLTVMSLERILAQGQPSAEDLADMQRLLEEELALPLVAQVFRNDRANFHRAMCQAENGEVELPREIVPRAWNWSVVLKRSHAQRLRFHLRFMSAARLSLDQRQALLERLEAELPRQLVARHMTSVYHRFAVNMGIDQTKVLCAVVGLAVERFRRTHSRWPTSLEELTPGFLHTVALDPHDGQRLRYRRLEDGMVVYSVGTKRVDPGTGLTGGNLRTSGVISFRLWDVEARRQPADGP